MKPSAAAPVATRAGPLLSVRDLTIAFGSTPVVQGVSFDLAPGETVGVVGSSGAGKTMTALSLTGLLPRAARVAGGVVEWEGEDVVGMSAQRLRSLRGREVGMVFQDALGALHPSLPVVDQVAEALTAHAPALDADEARSRALALLDEVGISSGRADTHRYPHEWSGGMRQRALIAIAIANDPKLIVADEPVTALDVTTQAQVLGALRRTLERTRSALLLVTHDLDVIADVVDRVIVLDAGVIIEDGTVDEVFARPREAHTRVLLTSRPSARVLLDSEGAAPKAGPRSPSATRSQAPTLLEVEDAVVRYRARRAPPFTAVDGVSLTVARGEAVGLVGESGCGKSSLARAIVGLQALAAGRIRVGGDDLTTADRAVLSGIRSRAQIVFQDPYASLNPRRRVEDIVAQPLVVHGRAHDIRLRVPHLLDLVGLSSVHLRRFPRELSGGQRQRVAIARALALDPELVVLDEPVSALDTEVQARIVDLLAELRRELGLGMLLIAHDLALVHGVTARTAVMSRGRIIETGPTADVFARPEHAETKALLAARLALAGRASAGGAGPGPLLSFPMPAP